MHAIIRIAKQKAGGLAAVEGHNLRLYPEPKSNIDPSRTHLNRRIVVNEKSLTTTINDRIQSAGVKRKIRHDAVMAVEYVLTASPAFFNADDRAGSSQKLDDWINANMAFIENRLGKENIVQAVLHMDETTPHLQVLAVPVLKDKDGEAILSAKEWTASGALRRLQTDYAMAMQPFGLKRGEIGSAAEHQPIVKDRANTVQLATVAQETAAAAVAKVEAAIERLEYQTGVQNARINKQKDLVEDVVQAQRKTIEDQRRIIEEQKTLTMKIMGMYEQAQRIIVDLKRRLGLGGGSSASVKPAADALGADVDDFSYK